MKLVVAGSRHLAGEHAWRELCRAGELFVGRVTEVVSGRQRGMDELGERWAREIAHVGVKPFPADWEAHLKAAGPIRKRAMAAYGDFAMVIWDGKSSGSADMLDAMRLACKPALSWIVRPQLQPSLFR